MSIQTPSPRRVKFAEAFARLVTTFPFPTPVESNLFCTIALLIYVCAHTGKVEVSVYCSLTAYSCPAWVEVQA